MCDFQSDECLRAGPALAHQFCFFINNILLLPQTVWVLPCRVFQKMPGYFFVAVLLPQFFYFLFFPLLHLKFAIKSRMKGLVKENDLSWNLPALRMFPELLAPECCLFPCTTCPVTYHTTLCNLPASLFWDCFPTTPACCVMCWRPANR